MPDLDEVLARPIATVVSSNARRGGVSEVVRVGGDAWPELGGAHGYLKRQTRYFCRPAWNAFRPTPTSMREARSLTRARARGVPVPEIVLDDADADGRSYLLTRSIAGASTLRDALAAADASRRAELIDATAHAFAMLHRARIVHGALYDTHVLIDAAGGVTLIDLEKARGAPSPSLAALADLPRFFRRARALSRDEEARVLDAYPPNEFRLLALWRRFAR